jgi:NTP pyrophosphatase (non-canonical NTP hydrolase)
VNVEKVKEELADVFNYALQIATKYDLDVKQIVEEKLAKNAAKYPVEKAKGVATKYDEL